MSNSSTPSKVYVQPGLLTRLRFSIRIRALKFISTSIFRLMNLPGIRDKSILPTFIKFYPSRPTLKHRFFGPKSYKTDDPLLPLYIDIHGGGFAIMSPIVDDKFCSEFSNQNRVFMIAVDYPKSPRHPFPAGVQAVTKIIGEILGDETLPFDRKKVAIGGFSAGANLALSVPQDENLQGKIAGAVAYYPPTNWTIPIPEKLAMKPKNSPPDSLEKNAPAFDYAYQPAGTNLEDPQLTSDDAQLRWKPVSWRKGNTQLDMLCGEAELMAKQLAQCDAGQRVGTDIAWEQNEVKWEKILGEEHAFDATPAFGAKAIRIAKRRQDMYDAVAEWLFRKVYV